MSDNLDNLGPFRRDTSQAEVRQDICEIKERLGFLGVMPSCPGKLIASIYAWSGSSSGLP